MQMDANQYLQERLDTQITWYDDKSAFNKKANTIAKIVEIVCAAVIPVLAGYARGGDELVSLGIGVLGVIVAATAGISAVMKFQEQWLKYRTTAESLKKEKYLFQTKVEPYDAEDSLPI